MSDLKFTSSDKYIHDPWAHGVLESIPPGDSVFIIGTGLSMVDVALTLKGSGHTGDITAISTKGLLPEVHAPAQPYNDFYGELREQAGIKGVFRNVLGRVKAAEANGGSWRGVIDSLRPHTQTIWQGLSLTEKRYFLNHISRYWNSARHRMPPSAAKQLYAMIDSGELKIVTGRLRHIGIDDGRFLVNKIVSERTEYLAADTVINCIGPQTNFTCIDNPLIKSLISAGHIRCDETFLGLDCTPDGRLLGADGSPSDRLRVLGTAMKGVLWETTAIPEIRKQAYDLSIALLE